MGPYPSLLNYGLLNRKRGKSLVPLHGLEPMDKETALVKLSGP